MSSNDRSRLGWTLALTSTAYFMVALDSLVVLTALPAIGREFGGGLSGLDWIIDAYLLAFAAGMITAAALGDRLGRRRVYVAGLLIFAAASAACALAPTVQVLVAARAVQGIGAAIVTPLSLTILTAAVPSGRRGTIIGIWGGVAGLAVAAGPLVGAIVIQGLSWHWVFWVNVPIGLAAALLSGSRLTESRGPATRLDLPGVCLVSVAAVCVAGGVIRAGAVGWGRAEVIAVLILGVLAAAGFVGWERRAAQPILPPRLFRSAGFAAAGLSAFLLNGALTSAAFLCTQYFQVGRGDSALGAGLRFLPWTGVVLFVAPLAGRLSDRIGPRPLLVAGTALQAAGLFWVAATASATVRFVWLTPGLVIAGVGISMALPTVAVASLGAVPAGDVGTASGVNNTLQRFGGVLGVAVVSAVFAAEGRLDSAAGVIAGIRPALAVAAGLSALGALSALAVDRNEADRNEVNRIEAHRNESDRRESDRRESDRGESDRGESDPKPGPDLPRSSAMTPG